MATLTPQVVPSSGGAAITYASATSGGDTISNAAAAVISAGGKLILKVRNGGGSSITATLAVPGACNFGLTGAAHNKAIVCAVGDTEIEITAPMINTDGTVAITYTAVTSVTVAVVTNA